MSERRTPIAQYFAHEVVGNEMKIVGYKFPRWLRTMVTSIMVTDDKLGWPDLESAEVHYDDYIETE